MAVKFTRLSVLLPITIGLLFGAILFAIGYTQDGPGACVMGLAFAFGFVMLGIRNAGIIKKGYLIPVLLLCYGAGVTFLDIVLFLDGEFEDYQSMFFVGLALGIIMFVAGSVLLRRRKKQ